MVIVGLIIGVVFVIEVKWWFYNIILLVGI